MPIFSAAKDGHDATMTNLIPVFSTSRLPGWPVEEGREEPPRATYVPLTDALRDEYPTDAHTAAYSLPDVPYRLRKAAIAHTDGVPMVAWFVDVDGPGHVATDAWWREEQQKLNALLFAHSGGFIYRTRGGYRIVYRLPEPFVIRTNAEAEKWKIQYLCWLLYIYREFGITGDPKCADWTRLYRLPHATRDEHGRPENHQVMEDGDEIRAWECEADVQAALETAHGLAEMAGGSPWRPAVKVLERAARRTGPSKRALAALEAERDDLARTARGERNERCNIAALKLGHYVASGELSCADVERELLGAMQANGSIADDGEGAARATIRSGLEAGMREPPRTPLRLVAGTSPPPQDAVRRLTFPCTDLGNAERLAARFGDRLRYCPPRKKWLIWNGQRWEWDETGSVMGLARNVVRSIYREAESADSADTAKTLASWAGKSESADRLSAMVKLAQTEQGIPVMPDALDANPWLFNCQNGTLDLRTGTLQPHNRQDLITKMAPVQYDPDAQSDIWDKFLSDATGGDEELVRYLQRVAGYVLTGDIREKCFFFLYGPPNAGKSTFIDALANTLGDYHMSSSFSTWCKQTLAGGNRGDIVRLLGARLVTSVEVQKGVRWDEEIVKRVTGGDEIVAAAKYEAEISFRASFKLLLAANDAPSIRDDDDGMWDRMRRIPFTHVPPERDPVIRRILCDPPSSGAAILAWAVQGCLAWQREGLGTCRAVEASTLEYRQEMDVFGSFLEDACVLEPGARVERGELARAYQDWCRRNNVRRVLAPREIADRLRERRVEEGKYGGARVWRGIRLVHVPDGPRPWQAKGGYDATAQPDDDDDDDDESSGSLNALLRAGKFNLDELEARARPIQLSPAQDADESPEAFLNRVLPIYHDDDARQGVGDEGD